MQMQVDREERTGKNIFDGYADYLRAVPANGNYDVYLRGDTLRGTCPFNGTSLPFVRNASRANPLTGNHEQELPVYDRNGDGRLQRAEHYVPGSRSENGAITGNVIFFGQPEHAFRMNGKRRIGMGTNPSTANMMTLVSTNTGDSFKRGKPNVRTVYLNGISVELLAMDDRGQATVRVRTDDTRLTEDVRWCADSIVLPPLKGYAGHALYLERGKRLLVDRSYTPTRLDKPEDAYGTKWFSAPTRFTVSEGASMMIGPRAVLQLEHGSEIHVLPGGSITFGAKAKLDMDADTRIVLHGNAALNGPSRIFKKARKKGRIVSM